MRYALCAAVAALLCASASPSMAAGVTVLRGGAAAQSAAGNSTILRGSGFAHAMTAAAETRPAATMAIAGGTVLWLIDADGQIKACGVRGSGRVGAPDVVHCSAGPVVQ